MIHRSALTIQRVKVKRLRPDVEIPQYHTDGAAGFDLALADTLFLEPGEIKLAPTGLVFAAPRNHMMYITFRSSTPRKWGVTVLEGILDEDYCGDDDECKIQVMSLARRAPFHGVKQDVIQIPAGTRIAQGIFVPVTRGEFVECDTMGESRGGWGSTGTGLEPRPVRKEF